MRLLLCAVFAVLTAGLGLGLGLGLQQVQPESKASHTRVDARFIAVDIFVDSGDVELGAYQVEVKAMAGGTPAPPAASSSKVTLVGVAGGEHAAFAEPPHYDAAALHEDQLKDRIVLAAFNTGKDLPKGKTKVAQIQVMVEGAEPAFAVVVMTAGAGDGTKINATAAAAALGDAR